MKPEEKSKKVEARDRQKIGTGEGLGMKEPGGQSKKGKGIGSEEVDHEGEGREFRPEAKWGMGRS